MYIEHEMSFVNFSAMSINFFVQSYAVFINVLQLK
jgi:hypothetical protein